MLQKGGLHANSIFYQQNQTCFHSPQSIGVIGGKPNQALYLIGCVEDEVIYLDPHTTQRSGLVENKITDDQKEMDSAYHCKYASRIPILVMDPSVAVCFLYRTRSDFDELCSTIATNLTRETQPLFDICEKRPSHWGPLNNDIDLQNTNIFTGLILEPHKQYSVVVKALCRITQVALDTSTGDDCPCQFMVLVGDTKFIVCTLQKSQDIQFKVSLYFKPEDNVTFINMGKSHMHLTGTIELHFPYNLMTRRPCKKRRCRRFWRLCQQEEQEP